MDGHTVRDSRFPLSVAGSAASSGFSLSPILGQAIASSGTAEDMTIDSLCADDVIPSVQFHPPGDLFGGPSRSKTVLPMIAQAGGTLDLRPPKFADPGSAVRAIRSLSVCVAVARQFPMDRPPMPSQTPRHLRHRHVHFHQPPQATSFFKRKGIVSRSHSDPRYTRWRTWCVNPASTSGVSTPLKWQPEYCETTLCTQPQTTWQYPRNNWGDTPLHIAALYGQMKAIAALLDAGADPKAPDENGRTPFDLISDDSPLVGTSAYWHEGRPVRLTPSATLYGPLRASQEISPPGCLHALKTAPCRASGRVPGSGATLENPNLGTSPLLQVSGFWAQPFGLLASQQILCPHCRAKRFEDRVTVRPRFFACRSGCRVERSDEPRS